MYMDGKKLLSQKKNELETQLHEVRIYIDGIGMEFNIEKASC